MSTNDLTTGALESAVPMRAYDRFRERCGPLWDGYVRHPWFEAVGRAGITDEQFFHFVVHDRPYVREFQQAQLRAAALFTDPDVWLPAFQLIADETDLEAGLLASDEAADWSVDDRWDVCPAREAYMNHIYLASSCGDAALAVASLLPCGSGFGEITRWLAEVDRTRHPHHLATWLDFYCTQAQWAYSDLLTTLLETAREVSHSTDDEQFQVFFRSLQHQIRVLDAAWTLDDTW